MGSDAVGAGGGAGFAAVGAGADGVGSNAVGAGGDGVGSDAVGAGGGAGAAGATIGATAGAWADLAIGTPTGLTESAGCFFFAAETGCSAERSTARFR